MTTDLFNKVIDCADAITEKFSRTGVIDSSFIDDARGVKDFIFTSSRYRRAHISTIDARQTKKLYLLHVTVFPHPNDNGPIYGFDIVCGPTKVSGAFHDFSEAGDPFHIMIDWFKNQTNGLEWNRPRELPDWAKAIFSSNMVAIGAVGPEELDEFIALGIKTLDYYLEHVGLTQESGMEYHMAQNRYCYYQKKNPRTPTSLQHLGFSEAEANKYVQNMLFPEIR